MSSVAILPVQQKVEGLGNNAKQLHVNTILDAIFLGHVESKAGQLLPGMGFCPRRISVVCVAVLRNTWLFCHDGLVSCLTAPVPEDKFTVMTHNLISAGCLNEPVFMYINNANHGLGYHPQLAKYVLSTPEEGGKPVPVLYWGTPVA